jgi:hypothetical protein
LIRELKREFGFSEEVGAAPATNVVFVSAQKLRCTVPAGSGTVDVTVRNPNGQEGMLIGGYMYTP